MRKFFQRLISLLLLACLLADPSFASAFIVRPTDKAIPIAAQTVRPFEQQAVVPALFNWIQSYDVTLKITLIMGIFASIHQHVQGVSHQDAHRLWNYFIPVLLALHASGGLTAEGMTHVSITLDGQPHQVWGVGHSNRKLEDFIALLKQAGIRTLVDVRTRPQSQFYPYFNRKALEASLAQHGIAYYWEGKLLGGKLPEYDGDFEKYMQEDPEGRFSKGITQLLDIVRIQKDPVALLCSEKPVEKCHRRFILDYLDKKWGSGSGIEDDPIAPEQGGTMVRDRNRVWAILGPAAFFETHQLLTHALTLRSALHWSSPEFALFAASIFLLGHLVQLVLSPKNWGKNWNDRTTNAFSRDVLAMSVMTFGVALLLPNLTTSNQVLTIYAATALHGALNVIRFMAARRKTRVMSKVQIFPWRKLMNGLMPSFGRYSHLSANTLTAA